MIMPPSFEDIVWTAQQSRRDGLKAINYEVAGVLGTVAGSAILIPFCLPPFTPLGVIAGGTLALLGGSSLLYGLRSAKKAKAKWTAANQAAADFKRPGPV
jgi:hypothetical protein